ncbi:hypothetical protein WICPIJ_001649 [Wickerhamomyces pijperi]|uniref:Uncharacterized protein n=1 Tax=Wickerhamomyces pijperi TaxID=599730 RepID=A0A9P8QD39_WICPI|nr:hypothetical protein WICPIJ_001649 [Wickerhamomyces pijperi]
MISLSAQSEPKIIANFSKLFTAASLIEGMYSMMASLTLHCLSLANSEMAGNKESANRSIPITSLTIFNLEMMFNFTSGNSSFNMVRNIGSKFLMTMSFGSNGVKPVISEAREDLTNSD